VVRKKGSHVRLRSDDGRVITVPTHGTKEIPRGLLGKIIRENLELDLEQFVRLYSRYKKRK